MTKFVRLSASVHRMKIDFAGKDLNITYEDQIHPEKFGDIEIVVVEYTCLTLEQIRCVGNCLSNNYKTVIFKKDDDRVGFVFRKLQS